MPASEVLIITGSMIGDVILSTGVIAEIVRRHDGARVTVVCSPGTAILFRHLPVSAEVIPMAKKKRGGHWLDLYGQLRRRSWVRIYDFRDSIVSRVLNGPRVTPQQSGQDGVHKVVEASSILAGSPPQSPVLWLSGREIEALPPEITSAERLLVLGPGASRVGKAWPVDRFAALAARLTAPGQELEGAVVVATGGDMDRAAAASIRAQAPDVRHLDLTGADLLTTAAVMARSDLFVGNDSGMMHLAAAAGAPTLGLFGPTDERLYGPWTDRGGAVRAPGVPVTFGKTSKTVSRTATQMEALSVEVVATAGERLVTGLQPAHREAL